MKIFLLLLLVTFSAHAATLESFFTSLEGAWKMDAAQTVTFKPDGVISTSMASRFDASVTRTDNLWKFSEEMCWSTDGAEDVCGEASVTYEVQDDSLYLIMDGAKIPLQVVDLGEAQLGITLKTEDYVFSAIIGVVDGVLVQDGFSEMSDGTSEYQSLRLLKQ